jgi:hypothetical protein
MRKIRLAFYLAAGLAVAGTPAKAEGISVGAGAGTLGYGIHVGTEINSFLVMRLNGNFGTFTFPDIGVVATDFGGIDYGVEAQMMSIGLVADFHPLGLSPIGSGLVISGGVYYNKNEFELTTGIVSVNVGGTDYVDINLVSNFSFDQSFAPYLGLGYDGTFQGTFPISFFMSAGVLYQGSPTVTLRDKTGFVAPADLKTEAAQIEDSVSNYEFYPVISMGLSITF